MPYRKNQLVKSSDEKILEKLKNLKWGNPRNFVIGVPQIFDTGIRWPWQIKLMVGYKCVGSTVWPEYDPNYYENRLWVSESWWGATVVAPVGQGIVNNLLKYLQETYIKEVYDWERGIFEKSLAAAKKRKVK